MEIEIVALDHSGTISGDIRPAYYANMKIFRLYGKPEMSLEEFRETASATVVEFLRSVGIEEDPDYLFNLYTKYFTDGDLKPVLLPYVKETCRYIASKGKEIAVLSGHPQRNLNEEIQQYGLGKYISSAWGGLKDKREALLKLSKIKNIPASSILFVSDTSWDIISAREAGAYSAAVLTGYHSKERLMKENPNFIFEYLNGLMRIL